MWATTIERCCVVVGRAYSPKINVKAGVDLLEWITGGCNKGNKRKLADETTEKTSVLKKQHQLFGNMEEASGCMDEVTIVYAQKWKI